MPRSPSRPVYSTDTGPTPEARAEARAAARAKARPPHRDAPAPRPVAVSLPPAQQTAHIRREKKGRGGKTVSVIHNLQLTPDDLKALAGQLKAACGTGGTVKDGTIEIQGDHRDTLAARLQALGYKTKLAGG